VDAMEKVVDSDGMKLNFHCKKAHPIYKSSVRSVAPILSMAGTLS
jgi:hypothetical protein